jgi:hypothetical protein
MQSALHRSPPRWPFWLLLAAWVCANSPQIATYALLTWLADARHFSHQQQLTREVAFLMAGEKSRDRPVAVVANEDPAPAPKLPPPAGAVLKKIDLTSEGNSNLAPPASAGLRLAQVNLPAGGRLRAPPPHGPPRTAAIA